MMKVDLLRVTPSDSELLGAALDNKITMENPRVCSACGMRSGRDGNVRRHILNKHGGRGYTCGVMEYMLKVECEELPPPSYRRQSGLTSDGSNARNKETPSEILIKHSIERIDELVEDLSYMKKKGAIIWAEVCEKCLSHKILFTMKVSEKVGSEKHCCDLAWIMDHANLYHDKNLAIQLLKSNIPRFMVNVIRKLREHNNYPSTLLEAIPIPDQLSPAEINAKCANMVANRLNEFTIEDYSKKLGISVADLRNLSYAPPKTQLEKKANHLERFPELNENYDWLLRAISKGATEVNEQELQEYFAHLQRTVSIIRVNSKLYRLGVEHEDDRLRRWAFADPFSKGD